MKQIINLKEQHKLYDPTKDDGGIGYAGYGAGFLKKSLDEKLIYCEDLDREETQELFDNQDSYYFGKFDQDWNFEVSPPMGKGKVAMWFAKFFKNGYYDEVSLDMD